MWTLRVMKLEERSVQYKAEVDFSQRFANDKLTHETEKYHIIFDGILLNSIKLKKDVKTDNLGDVFVYLYEKYDSNFILKLSGSFNGALYDKRKGVWLFFVNQYGDRPLFYIKTSKQFVISSDFNVVVNYSQKYVNEFATKCILTYGYMIDNSTHVKDVFRLMAGHCLILKNCKEGIDIEAKQYHLLNNIDILNIGYNDAIEELNKRFEKAVMKCFEKDLEYGYQKHLVDISGGLDSRMINVVAKKLGYNNIVNLTYSQSDSDEWKIALKISNHLKNDLIFTPIDSHNFVFNIDEYIKENYGLALYCACTGARTLLYSLNKDEFGIEHTGQLGDVIVGSYLKKMKNGMPQYVNTYSSSKTLNYDFPTSILDKYNNLEQFVFYSRGFSGILNSHLVRNNYMDVLSTFLDEDFLEFCFSLPIEYRKKHSIYLTWIKKKYPDILRIESTRCMPNYQTLRYFKKALSRILQITRKHLNLNPENRKSSMNPYDYWYHTDPKLKIFIIEYFNCNIERVDKESLIYNDLHIMMKSNSVMDKLLALTVLGVYKNYELKWDLFKMKDRI